MKTVLDEHRTIFTVDGVLGAEECRALVAQAEKVGFVDAPITTSRGFVMDKDIRDNTRVMLDDRAHAEELFRRLSPFLPKERGEWRVVGLNERLRFYRYEPGQRFAWHYDGAFVRNGQERSLLTVLLYLNDDCLGGETEIDLGELLVVRPKEGAALLFEHHVRHQGSPVTHGRKYVLRTDVMVRRDERASSLRSTP